MSLTGRKAPYFSAEAVVKGKDIETSFSLTQYAGKKNVLLFFYPKDFSIVSTAEMYAFQEKWVEFDKRETVVVGCSTDSPETHLAWLHTPRELGGIAGVKFPVIADSSKIVSMNYEILAGDYTLNGDSRKWTFTGIPYAARATFIIDKKGIVRHQSVNDFALERNIDEYLRLLDAQIADGKPGETEKLFSIN